MPQSHNRKPYAQRDEGQGEEIKVAVASDPADYGYNVWDGPKLFPQKVMKHHPNGRSLKKP